MPDDEKKDLEVETPSEEVSETTPTVEEKQEIKPTEATPESTEKAPEVTPVVATETANPAPVATTSSAGTLVLQWLTYAFWGWLILGLIWLMGIVLANAIFDEPVTGAIPYAIAASGVLLPLAFFTDRFYSRREPLTKTGGEAVIMIIHAVIFAILGIIALIATVFVAINLSISITGSSESDSQLMALSITGFSALLYAAAFIRTLNPFKSRQPLRIYRLAMLGLTILLLVLALVGPLAKGFATRNDRLIEQNLPSVESSITSYVEENNKLPDSLKDLPLDDREASILVKDNLVEYKKDPSVTKKNLITGSTTTEHRYQLCVDYTSESRNYNDRPTYYNVTKKEYESYLSTSEHGAGRKCYKLQASTTKYKEDTSNGVDIQVENL